ncbi:hypothetical protein Tco_0463653, partial [Tanacetum coccineum]
MPEDPYAYIMAVYEVPPSPDYIPGLEVSPSPDYIPDPEVPPSPDYIPSPEETQSPPLLDFVPEPMYLAEERPLPAAASPTGFVDMVDVAPGHPMSRELNYGITDTWDDLVGAIEEITPTTLEGVNQRVTNL